MNKKPLIGILESIHQDGINLLKKFSNVYLDTGKSKKKIFENVKHYDVIFIKSNIQINKEFIESAKNLKIVARAGTGTDNVDLDLLEKRKIKFFSTPGLNSKSVAELTIAFILILIKKLPDLDKAVSKGDYRRHLFLSKDLSELKVGLVGIGNVGIEVAKIDTSITEINRNSNRLNEEIDKLESDKKNTNLIAQELDTIKIQLEEIDIEKKKVIDEKQYIDIAREILNDTGVKANIIKKYLPIMNQLINENLQAMDFFVNFHLNEEFE